VVLYTPEKQLGNGERDSKGRFLPGNKGGGRPAIAFDFRIIYREFMEKTGGGWDTLIDMASSTGKHQHAALQLITAYAYGKPVNPVAAEVLAEVNTKQPKYAF